MAVLALLLGLYDNSHSQANISLSEAIRLSQEHSFGIRSALYDSAAAASDFAAARAYRLPTASLNAVSYYINNLQSVDFPYQTVTMGTHENYQADLRLTMPLYTGGRISNQIGMQKSLAQSRGANLEAARFNEAYAVRKAYLGQLAAMAVEAAANASIERVGLIGADVTNSYINGLADSSDILDAQLALEKARQAQNEKAVAVGNARALLSKLIGEPFDAGVVPSDSIPPPDYTLYENQRPTAETVKRLELKATDNRIQAAKYLIGVNKAAYQPALNAYGGYSVGKPNKDLFNKTWNDYWVIGLNLNWEFNLGGRSVKNVSSAGNSAKAAYQARQDLLELLTLQANIAWANLKLSFDNYLFSRKQYEIAQHQFRIGREKQRAGKLAANRLLELEADLTAIEQLYKASTVNYFISETEYLFAIGSPRIYGGLQ